MRASTVRWGQIWRGMHRAELTDPADRARLDALGLRLILDLRSDCRGPGRDGLCAGRCPAGADLRPCRETTAMRSTLPPVTSSA